MAHIPKGESELSQLFYIRDKQSEGAFPGRAEETSNGGELSLYSPLKVVIFVALMCIMLVLMYFFYRYLGKYPDTFGQLQ